MGAENYENKQSIETIIRSRIIQSIKSDDHHNLQYLTVKLDNFKFIAVKNHIKTKLYTIATQT